MRIGKMEVDIDRWIGAVSAVMVVVKRKLSSKAKLCLCSIAHQLYDHKLWVVTPTQADEMACLCRVARLNLRDGVQNSDIQRELIVESLLFPVERSQLRCFGRLGCLPFLGISN